jgi:hypothetical protein
MRNLYKKHKLGSTTYKGFRVEYILFNLMLKCEPKKGQVVHSFSNKGLMKAIDKCIENEN